VKYKVVSSFNNLDHAVFAVKSWHQYW